MTLFYFVYSSHQNWFAGKNPLLFPLGKMMKYLRQECRVRYSLTSDGLQIKESMPRDFNPSVFPADVEPLREYS